MAYSLSDPKIRKACDLVNNLFQTHNLKVLPVPEMNAQIRSWAAECAITETEMRDIFQELVRQWVAAVFPNNPHLYEYPQDRLGIRVHAAQAKPGREN